MNPSGTNLKSWNEYTESKFLDQLKLIGQVYIYQDKIHNIWHYDNTNPEKKDFDSDIDKDKIMFYNSEAYKRISPEMATWNLYNSESWWFPVGTGALVMFPSELQHMVEQKQGKNLRTSLSFNTFIKGDIGVHGELTELKL